MPAHLDAALALAVAVLVLVGMALEWRSPEVLALSGAAVLLATGALEINELRSVFSNPGALTIGAMFVIGGALQSTGAVDYLGTMLQRYQASRSQTMAVVGVMLTVMIASAFINNTAIVVIMTPIVIAMAKRMGEAPSRLLIPLSYVAILGGSCTLIGSSTNLLVDGIATQSGLAPFGVFELTLPGVLIGAVALGYLALVGRRLLPERPAATDVLEENGRKRFLTELVITSSSNLAGKTVEKLEGPEIEIVEVRRANEVIADEADRLRPGDRVILEAPAGEAVHLRGEAEPVAVEDGARENLMTGGYEILRETEMSMREGIVRPGSHYEGREVGSLNLRRLFDVRILAVHRQGGEIRWDFERVRLQMGDNLLLEGPPEGLKRLFDTRELVSLGEPILHRTRIEKAPIAIAAVAAVVILGAFEVLPLAGLALIAAVALLATNCIRMNAALDSIDWRILFLIFGMLAIGRGLETSGAIELIVGGSMGFVTSLSPWVLVSLTYLFASLLTELVTNNAVAIVVTPIAIAVATELGLDPRPFAVAVMFAGSASFATPLGYQTNTFVYGAGNYRFMDFVRVGAPLNVIVWLVASLLIPVFWPIAPA